jgi:hypothetical protein
MSATTVRRPVLAVDREPTRAPDSSLAQSSAGGASDEGGDDVGGVPVEGLSAPVIAHLSFSGRRDWPLS